MISSTRNLARSSLTASATDIAADAALSLGIDRRYGAVLGQLDPPLAWISWAESATRRQHASMINRGWWRSSNGSPA